MTREEIIDGLQFTIDMFLFDPSTGETLTEPRNDMDKITIDACKGAIELLEQEPCEDAISREQAIDVVADLFEMSEYPHPYPQGKPIRLRDIKEKLKQLPSVQPKPKTGQWVLLDECSNSGYYCSECHKKLVKEGWSNTVKKIKYCPNCGCRMYESQESEVQNADSN